MKDYADTYVGHDGDGYVLVDVDGTPTKVYTKYLTGTLDADTATDVAHGITGVDNILAVTASVYSSSSSTYHVDEHFEAGSSNPSYWVGYDGTNIKFSDVGSESQGQKYRIRIDYEV